ncbi:DUF2076 domain-containing protein [Pseudomonas huanghezhanensis]|uniref:DUF2076 domain-containing protein n=1 Tax=Pseudomonas huanghezhanensis TaxID=3002903 RepID=UPI0022855DC0|nr:DUF2076 domain-containing protein [Pseudomonas sp. BSw22131]
MNSEEQTLIDDLFVKLKQAEKDSAIRDAQAEARIKEHLGEQPGAPYYMAQAIIVQEVAIKQLEAQSRQRDEQIQQLQTELQRAKAQAPATAQSGGFLSSIFGGGAREPQAQQPSSFSQQRPSNPQPSSGGWRDSGPASPPPYNSAAPQGNYAQPQQPPQQQAPASPMGSGFLGGALKTAAGVAGGVMLAQGISSLFHQNSQPQEIVEVIKEEPAQNVSDTFSQDSGSTGGWNDDQQNVTSNDNWGGNNDAGGFADTDYGNDDGGGMFDDDDSFV